MDEKLDQASESLLGSLSKVQGSQENVVAGVKSVLVVLSSRGLAYDKDALRHKILVAYPEAAVFFLNTGGKPIGVEGPSRVDLLIDFTGPRQRQPWCFSRKLRSRARFAIGRDSGFFRKKIYDRVIPEGKGDLLTREREVQKNILIAAGVAVGPQSEILPDRSHTIALDLPPLR